jgi:hypothetical protein
MSARLVLGLLMLAPSVPGPPVLGPLLFRAPVMASPLMGASVSSRVGSPLAVESLK